MNSTYQLQGLLGMVRVERSVLVLVLEGSMVGGLALVVVGTGVWDLERVLLLDIVADMSLGLTGLFAVHDIKVVVAHDFEWNEVELRVCTCVCVLEWWQGGW